MRRSFVLLLLSTVLFSTQAQPDKIRVAVNDLQPNGIDSSAARVISDRLRAEMVNTGLYTVMERGEMETILEEQGFQQSGACDDQACLVEVGQLLGVDRMLAGSIGKLGNLHTISLRMIDIKTGEILYTVNEDCPCPVERVLSDATRSVVVKLVKRTQEVRGDGAVPRLGTVAVSTDPQGARVLLDGTRRGITPCRLTDVSPGTYALRVELEEYQPVVEQIDVHLGTLVNRSYRLEYTDEHIAKVKREGRRGGRRGRTVRRIVFGALSVGCGATGFLLEKRAAKAYDEYSQTEHSGFPAARKAYYGELWDPVQTAMRRRNIMYGVAGLSALGLGISIFF
jgi:hypothetical protein